MKSSFSHGQYYHICHAPNKHVLAAMHFYIISFSKGYMPVCKKNPQHVLTWENDAELDRLLALNSKINEGTMLDSLREDMAEKEEAVRSIERAREHCNAADTKTMMRMNAALTLPLDFFSQACYNGYSPILRSWRC